MAQSDFKINSNTNNGAGTPNFMDVVNDINSGNYRINEKNNSQAESVDLLTIIDDFDKTKGANNSTTMASNATSQVPNAQRGSTLDDFAYQQAQNKVPNAQRGSTLDDFAYQQAQNNKPTAGDLANRSNQNDGYYDNYAYEKAPVKTEDKPTVNPRTVMEFDHNNTSQTPNVTGPNDATLKHRTAGLSGDTQTTPNAQKGSTLDDFAYQQAQNKVPNAQKGSTLDDFAYQQAQNNKPTAGDLANRTGSSGETPNAMQGDSRYAAPNTDNYAISENNVATATVADLSTIPKTGTVAKENIDFTRISNTAQNSLNGNYVHAREEYWGDEGDLTYEIRDDGTILISENGVALGFTDLQGISKGIDRTPTTEDLGQRTTPQVEIKEGPNAQKGSTIDDYEYRKRTEEAMKNKEQEKKEEPKEDKPTVNPRTVMEFDNNTSNKTQPEIKTTDDGHQYYEENGKRVYIVNKNVNDLTDEEKARGEKFKNTVDEIVNNGGHVPYTSLTDEEKEAQRQKFQNIVSGEESVSFGKFN